jgi:hypothetical protein
MGVLNENVRVRSRSKLSRAPGKPGSQKTGGLQEVATQVLDGDIASPMRKAVSTESVRRVIVFSGLLRSQRHGSPGGPQLLRWCASYAVQIYFFIKRAHFTIHSHPGKTDFSISLKRAW